MACTADIITHTLATGEQTTYTREDDGFDRPKTTVTGPDGAATVSQSASGTDSTITQTAPDGTEIVQRGVVDPRWTAAAAGGSGSVTTPGDKTTTIDRTSKVTRGSSDDRNDPFAYQSLIDTLTVDGRTTTSTYVKDQRKVTTTSPMGRTSSVVFNEEDRAKTIAQTGRANTALTYDSRGRLTKVAQAGEESTIAYGVDGYVSEVTDEEGGTTTFARDDVGRATQVTGPDDETTEVDYDAAGQVETITAPDGRQFTFEYDDDGNVTAASRGARSGSGGPALESELAYDNGGRIERLTAASGNEIELDYDAAGRSTVTEATDGTSTTNTYEATGGRKLESVETDAGVETSLEYDGPLNTKITTAGDTGVGSETAVEYDYDNSQRPVEETIDGDTIAATINNDDQLTAVGDVQIGYDAASGDAETITAGETRQTIGVDNRGLPSQMTSETAVSTTPAEVFDEEIVRDGLGRIVERTETAGGPAATYTYAYNDAGELTGISTPLGQVEGFGYNSTGGLISKGVGLLALPIPTDGHGRPTADASGNPITWSTDGEATSLPRPGGGQSTLTYDGFGRLKTITGGGDTAQYTYDGLGRRVALKINGQLVRRLVYGGGLFPRARLDASGDVLERYVYASREHVPDLVVRRDGTRLRLITDSLGSVRVVIDADTGAVVQRLAYTAYGQVTQDTNPGAQPFGYKGSLSDPAAEGAGLVWNGVRAYIPSLGRFLTPEPLGIEVAWDEHAAFAGDPINLIDPTGQFAIPAVLWIGAGVAAASDLVAQVAGNVINGCPAFGINWNSVGVSGVVGALPGAGVVASAVAKKVINNSTARKAARKAACYGGVVVTILTGDMEERIRVYARTKEQDLIEQVCDEKNKRPGPSDSRPPNGD